MSGSETCYCGHVADEHAPNKRGQPAECTICECVHFEEDAEAE